SRRWTARMAVRGMAWRRLARCLGCLPGTLLIAAMSAAPDAAGAYGKSLGVPSGVSSTNLHVKITPMPFWNAMLARWEKSASCSPVRVPGALCTTAGWKEALARGRGLTGLDLLRAVNTALNPPNYQYVTDQANWGVPDYW